MSEQPQPRLQYEPLVEWAGATVSRSPWGPEDEIGRLNWISGESQAAILARLSGSTLIDLSVEYRLGMPSWVAAGDPPYEISMTHTPRGSIVDDLSGAGRVAHERYSYCGDAIHMYTHCGTHIDTLNHVGYHGRLWNGWSADEHLGSRCWTRCGPEKYPPIIARGILIDVADLHGVDCLPDSYAISADDIASALRARGTQARAGDVVLIRLGRMTRWPDFDGYLANSPGLSVGAARYLCEELGAMCVAVDTIGADVFPAAEPDALLPVHAYMFATAGTPIMEVVAMEELAAAGLHEFAFLGFPLKFAGATGAPMRPLAVGLR
jgi:kynurenine formamidase